MKVNRLNAIEQYILQQGTASIDELCETFNVSKNTVRRDLSELSKRGYIAKVYGGVTAVNPANIIPVPERISANAVAKSIIGKLAARFVRDNDCVFIDSGTTVINILPHISDKRNVTVVANCLKVLSEATKSGNFNIISLGGFYSHATDSFVGISAYESLQGLRINKAFMAATGISVTAGLTNNSFLDAEIKRGIVARSNSVYTLLDSTKFGREATLSFCPADKIAGIITEKEPSFEYIDYFNTKDIALIYE